MMVISEDCKNFIWELDNYRTDEKNQIPKENDHLIDAFRYMLANSYYNRLEWKPKIEEDGRRYYRIEDDLKNKTDSKDPFAQIYEEYYL